METGNTGIDISIYQSETETQQKSGVLARLQIYHRMLPLIQQAVVDWLADLIKVTDEEQENAGVYLGHLGDE